MRLVHYAGKRLGRVRAEKQRPEACHEFAKPRGLWVSADDHADNWRDWCLAEGWALDRLTHVHDVRLKKEAPVLFLDGVADLDRFTNDFGVRSSFPLYPRTGIDWARVAGSYHGLVIAPYVWERRLNGEAFWWYYGWDCASGCIWNPKAIASVRLREIVPVPEPASEAA